MALMVCNKLLLILMWLFRNLLELGDKTELPSLYSIKVCRRLPEPPCMYEKLDLELDSMTQPKFVYLQQLN